MHIDVFGTFSFGNNVLADKPSSLYFNTTAAFYALAQELAVGYVGTAKHLGHIMARLQLPADAQQQLAAWLLGGGSAVADTGVDGHVVALMRACMSWRADEHAEPPGS